MTEQTIEKLDKVLKATELVARVSMLGEQDRAPEFIITRMLCTIEDVLATSPNEEIARYIETKILERIHEANRMRAARNG